MFVFLCIFIMIQCLYSLYIFLKVFEMEKDIETLYSQYSEQLEKMIKSRKRSIV